MSIHFLCPTHRDWVYFHSDEALAYIDDIREKGDIFYQQHLWREATPFLGCAFEAVEILLELYGAENVFLLNQLTSLGLKINECFVSLHLDEHNNGISQRVLIWLETALQKCELNTNQRNHLVGCKCALTKNFSIDSLPMINGVAPAMEMRH